ncbi:MAG: hypothetical protein OHK0045_20260 [Raineya sp.]
MQNSKKQVGILLAVLIIPAFFFILFQASFKNYYKLPYLSKEGESKPHQVQPFAVTKDLKIPQKQTFWVVGYDQEKGNLSDSLLNNFARMSRKEDLKKLLEIKLKGFQIKYLILGKDIKPEEKDIFVLPEGSNPKDLLFENKGEIVLIDEVGFVRGRYALLNKNNFLDEEELERLLTEIKVLIEIVANPRKK